MHASKLVKPHIRHFIVFFNLNTKTKRDSITTDVFRKKNVMYICVKFVLLPSQGSTYTPEYIFFQQLELCCVYAPSLLWNLMV
jgi:hypothetical protein